MKVSVTQEFDLESRWSRLKMNMVNFIEWLPAKDLEPIYNNLKKAYESRAEKRRTEKKEAKNDPYSD